MKELIKYVRNSQKQPVATIACVSVDGKIGVGFTVHNNKADEWNKDMGRDIAIGRAHKNAVEGTTYEFPKFRTINHFGENKWLGSIIESEMRTMSERGTKFFKGCNV